MPTTLGTGGNQRSFDINSSAAEARTWFVYSTVIALALVVLFYALRWALTGRLRPLWPVEAWVEK
ncbi:MAG: hypothetical protein HY020_02975 [Burkholderiales bacterium]|nr:hypothetical protein [Burkholderiales bacterium]